MLTKTIYWKERLPMNNNITNKKYFEDKLIHHSIYNTTFTLNHKSLNVIESFEDDNYIAFECVSKSKYVECNSCGCIISRVKDCKIIYPLYAMINNKPVILKLHKKLFYCTDCNSSTIDQPIDIKPYAQKSTSYVNMMMNDLKEQNTYSIVARRYQVSVSNVIFQFDKYRKTRKPSIYSDIECIAVDEVRFIPNAGKYQFVVMDHATGNVVDILDNRYGSTVRDYIHRNIPHVKVMSLDFWNPYRNAVKGLSQPVTIVSDKFHLARFASWGFNRTRVSIQKKTGLKLGKSWKLQSKSRHKLCLSRKRKVDSIVAKHKTLEAAYNAKNYFFAILRMQSSSEYEYHIQKWLKYIKTHQLTEFYFIETTLNNWNDEITNMYNTTYSNGSIERINRTIKQAKNIAFGFRNLPRSTDLIKLRTSA